MKLVKNKPSPAGRDAGTHLARLAAPAIEICKKSDIQCCKTCAYIEGTFPNGCITTIMDAVKCTIEGTPFLCHDKKRSGEVCSGWLALRLSTLGKPDGRVPWEFSDQTVDEQKS